jgi:hypothetical protein
MMSWTNFVFLGIGLAAGISGSRWFRRSKAVSPAAESIPLTSTSVTDPEKLSLQAELQQAKAAYQLAEEMGKFKAGFLARTSHELRSPLNSVISLHQLILSDLCDSPAEERDFVAKAHTAALKMLSMLDELIHVAKTTHGSNQLEIQPIQLKVILAEVHRLIHMQAENRSLRLEIDFPDPSVYVLVDPRWLRQVLVSLIDTPISLMYEGSIRVKTHLAPETKQVHIWVEDERPASTWQEPIDLLHLPQEQAELCADPMQFAQEYKEYWAKSPENPISSSLALLRNQTILELMQGKLEILATPIQPSETGTEAIALQTANVTRIQCTIPLALETE